MGEIACHAVAQRTVVVCLRHEQRSGAARLIASAGTWRAASLDPKGLSQGDVGADVPIGKSRVPATYLGRDTWPAKGKMYWPQTVKLVPLKTDGCYVEIVGQS